MTTFAQIVDTLRLPESAAPPPFVHPAVTNPQQVTRRKPMDYLFDEASDRSVLEAFHMRNPKLRDEPLPLRTLIQHWSNSGLRASDMMAAVNRLTHARLIAVSGSRLGPVLVLSAAGRREIEDSFGRGRSRGEDWIAEITVLMTRRRIASGTLPSVERRAA